jgi:hypothetical protein
MDDSLIPEIAEFVKKFDEGSAYSGPAEKYVHFLWLENKQFRDVLAGRDARVISLLRENADLKKKIQNPNEPKLLKRRIPSIIKRSE